MTNLIRALLYDGLLRSPPDDPAGGAPAGGQNPPADPSPVDPAPSPGLAAPDPSAPSGQALALSEADTRLPDTLLGSPEEGKVPALASEGGKAVEAAGDKKPAVADPKAGEGDKAPAPGDPAPPAKVEGEAKPDATKLAEPAPIVPLDPVLYGEILLPEKIGEGSTALKVVPVPELITEFTTTLGKFGVAKEAAQPLADLHLRAMERFAVETRREQYREFHETVAGWGKTAMADPQFGGAGFETSKAAMQRMIQRFASRAEVGSKQYVADHAAFQGFLKTTGVGSHPVFMRMLHNIARMFDEPPPPAHVGNPPPNNGQKPIRRFRDTYDHERSNPSNRQ